MTNKLSKTSWSVLSIGKVIGVSGMVIGYTLSNPIAPLFAGIGTGMYVFCDLEQERQRGVE